MIDKIKIWTRKQVAGTDMNLLIFLLLFVNVKLVVKLAAVIFIYFRRFDLSFKFSSRQPGIPLFYPAMMIIGCINFFIFSLYRQEHYTILFITGMAFWALSILAFHQVALSVKQSSLKKIHQAVFLFFVINAFASLTNIISIIIETGVLNPYRYQGNYQKYFISTGDYIKGISFDTSNTNAILNAFGVVYFLSRKQMAMSLLCMLVLLLTFSNFTNLLIMACLVGLFVSRTNRDQKSVIMIQVVMFVLFMTNVSPQNSDYTENVISKTLTNKTATKKINASVIPIQERPDNILSADEKKYKFAKLYLDSESHARNLATSAMLASQNKQTATAGLVVKPEIPKVSIHAPENQHRPDSSAERMQAVAFLKQIENQSAIKIDTPSRTNQLPGKVLAFKQLAVYMKEHPSKIITGDGMGNFSSKLAFRATGLKIAGGYPARYTYINDDFKRNHLLVYLNFFGKDSGSHSIANYPNSFYAQLLGEYGLIGVGCFLLYYLLYFMRDLKKLTYGLPILFIVLGALAVEYWFEQLSIIIVFELLLLLNRRESTEIKIVYHE